MRIYEIYLDAYFIENSVLDAAMLTLALVIMKRKIVPWRVLAAALLGGLCAVLVLVLQMRYGIFYILMVLATDLLMLFTASGLKAGGLFWGVFYFHTLALSIQSLTHA